MSKPRKSFVEIYKGIRKEMPPPKRVIPSKKRQIQDRIHRREIERGGHDE